MNVLDQISDSDLHWMHRALELARRGIGVTSPNPAVGCAILDRAAQVAGCPRSRFMPPIAQS